MDFQHIFISSLHTEKKHSKTIFKNNGIVCIECASYILSKNLSTQRTSFLSQTKKQGKKSDLSDSFEFSKSFFTNLLKSFVHESNWKESKILKFKKSILLLTEFIVNLFKGEILCKK